MYPLIAIAMAAFAAGFFAGMNAEHERQQASREGKGNG